MYWFLCMSCAFDAREPRAQKIMTSFSKDVCLFYYTPVLGDHIGTKHGEWLCKMCGKTRLKSGGWTNLLNHLGSCVGLNYKAEYQALVPDKTCSSIMSYVLRVNDVEQDMFRWLDWVDCCQKLAPQNHWWPSHAQWHEVQTSFFKGAT